MSKLKEKGKKLIDDSTFLSILMSVFSTAALVMSLLTVSYSFIAIIEPEGLLTNLRLYGSLAFAMLFIIYSLTIYKLRKSPKRFKYIFYSSVSFLIAIFMAIFGLNIFAHQFLMGTYFAMIAVGQVLSIIGNRKKRNIVVSVLFFIISIVLILVTYALGAQMLLYESIGMLLIAANCIGFVIIEALAKIQLAQLSAIIRKTYALEVVLGLFSLIISFSFVFMLIEGMSYGDALWYCFAIVTTIGFGDVASVSVIGRILSVILGFYGIIVVAVITSIIVNFYNETKYIGKKEDTEEDTSQNKDDENKNN